MATYDCVFLDLAKAFDSVPHHGIVKALSEAGAAGSLLDWFSHYLTNRSQFVVVQGSSSNAVGVTSGVPLGPLLSILAFDVIFWLPISPESLLTGYADEVT